MRRQIPQPLGLMESSPAGSVPLGHTDEEINVRDWDERGQRARTASRSGILPLYKTNPCPASSPVTHAFTAKRALSQYQFRELTEAAQSDVNPTQVQTRWTEALESAPLGVAVGPDGLGVALLSTGAVVVSDRDGRVEEAFTVPVPTAFQLVPSIAVDGLGGVYVAASYELQIDGGASRVFRFRRDEDADWEQQYEEVIPDTIERFWEADLELYMALRRPENVEDGPQYALGRYGGIQANRYSEAWKRSAPEPLVAMDFRGGVGYFAASPNAGRTSASGGGSASVDWTPRALTNADQRLYSWHSALREQNFEGLIAGDSVAVWNTAKLDPSDFNDVIDTTQRRLVQVPGPAGAPEAYQLPTFEIDPNGYGPELRCNLNADTRAPQYLYSGPNSSNMEKSSGLDVASWQRATLPQMEDAASDGHAFGFVILVRIENYETTSVSYTDPKVIWQMGEYVLSYTGNAGNTQITLDLQVPGVTQPTGAPTLALTDSECYACISLVCNGYNVAGASYWRVNGTQVETFEISEPAAVGSRMNIGYSFTYGASSVYGAGTGTLNRFRGGYKELIPLLGSNSVGIHDAAPTTDEVERSEGYATNAYGLQSILALGHPWNNGPPDAPGSAPPGFDFEDAFQDPNGLLVKFDRSSGDLRWVYSDTDAGAGVAVADDDKVYTIGTPLDLTTATPNRLARLTDNGDTVTVDWQVAAGATGEATVWRYGLVQLTADPCGRLYVPWTSIGTTAAAELRKYDTDGTLMWTEAISEEPVAVARGGLFVDDPVFAQVCADEFVYVVSHSGAFQRVDVMGRFDTGETRGQETQVVASCRSGVVSRLTQAGWTQVVSDFNPGGRPWSFELYGQHFIGGPEDYRVWDPRTEQMRNWTPSDGSLIPPRIYAAVRWRGRVLCVSEDNRNILYGSEYGNAFGFQTGGEILTATQAFAGTTAAAGAIPDPIVALRTAGDDLVYVLTTRSTWRLTGDPQTGGQLDDVLASEGCIDTWAHTRGDAGELYWMTTAHRVVQLGPGGLVDISSTSIRGRLQRVNPETTRIEMIYSDREQGLYLLFFDRDGGLSQDIEHVFWSKRTGRWHPTQFPGGVGRVLTSAGVLENADAGGWGAMWGFADGGLRFSHPEAFDDDGVPIHSRMRIPLSGHGDPQQALLTYAEVVLDPRQGPVRVVGVAGRTGDEGDDYGHETLVVPGRGDNVNLQIAGSHTWIEVIGEGQPWAIDDMAVDIHVWGAA